MNRKPPGGTEFTGAGMLIILFTRGNGTNCIRIVPYSAVQFSSYGIYKKVLATDSDMGWNSFDIVTRS